MATASLWSWSTGERGASRVRVYERHAGGPLQIEWRLDDRRVQKSLEEEVGLKVFDKKLAMKIAENVSKRLAQGHNQRVREVVTGPSAKRTLGELLKQLHANKELDWSASHARDQKRFRAFWQDKLGPDLRLTLVNAAMVEAVARKEATEQGWSPRTHGSYLRYIVDAFYYGERKLKWLEGRHNLSAVDIPAPNSKGKAYSLDEVRRLLVALERVDPVAAWLGHVLWQTGRRLTAVRTLPKTAVTVGTKLAVIRWPEETDKAGKEGWSVVVERAFELTRELMTRPGGYVAGKEPPDYDLCEKEWLPAAERIAEIEHVERRAWHGIKRRFANLTEGMKSRAAQAGTREDTLGRVYDPADDLEAMEEVARALAGQVAGR